MGEVSINHSISGMITDGMVNRNLTLFISDFWFSMKYDIHLDVVPLSSQRLDALRQHYAKGPVPISTFENINC